MSGNPLDPAEQNSIDRLWKQRLNGTLTPLELGGVHQTADPRIEFFTLRAKILGIKLKDDNSIYDFRYSDNVLPDAFANALKTLRTLVEQFGQCSAEVKDWLTAQDNVFGTTYGNPSDPPPGRSRGQCQTIRFHRVYQEAAAKFYAGDPARAKELFEAIAKDKTSPWKDLASYMAARMTVKIALDNNDEQSLDDASRYIKDTIAANSTSKYKPDLLDLSSAIDYRTSAPADSLQALTASVMQKHNNRLGSDTGDLTFLLNENLDESGAPRPMEDAKEKPPDFPFQKYDLTDWLITLHQPDETWLYLGSEAQKQLDLKKQERAKHAMAKWRQTHCLPWFVAAVCLNNLGEKENHDLAAAAAKIQPDSKAFLTAKFFLVDGLIKSNHKAEAHKILQDILGRKDVPPTTRNLFMDQMLIVCTSVEEYLQNMVQRPACVSTSFCPSQLPDNWDTLPSKGTFYSSDPVFAESLINDLNANLPQKYWVTWAENKTLPKQLRAHIILAAWLRSKLLGQESGLDDLFAQAYPSTKKLMATYRSAPAGPAKRFALACLILSNCGMSPYLEPGIGRRPDDIHDWDCFNENFWLPLPPPKKTSATAGKDSADAAASSLYTFQGTNRIDKIMRVYSKPVLQNALSPADKKQLADEQTTLFKNHPSYFLGEPILDSAKSHPRDARAPSMLYSLVRLPKWSSRSDVGTKYSKAAFQLLHKQYPDSSWAQKADYWY